MYTLEEVKKLYVLLKKLVGNDLKSRYSGSVFGIVWAFIQPLVTILVFWYVFQIGFRNPPVDNIEFILWFIAADIPWIYFNDAVLSSANVLYEYSYLVKKMKFRVWMLPIIKVFSSLYIHVFFMIFIVGMYFLYGYSFQISWIGILYYSFALTILVTGIAFIVSSLAVFLKDASQIVGIILQIGFWLTPVFWADHSMNPSVLRVLKLNPLYYIIHGYRDSLIYGISFWEESIKLSIYFWVVTGLVSWVGIKIYKKLKVHFADLL